MSNQRVMQNYENLISHSGHRLTPQRREVYDVLFAKRDHPTATEVFFRVQKHRPGISLATVYNCLETLVECGLAIQINIDREATRYCPNLQEHGHFICERCGQIVDVPLASKSAPEKSWKLPKKFLVTHSEITLRGLCESCNTLCH